jgi:hypothetical protein
VRGREGTTGVQHTSVRTWVHVATANDFTQTLTTATLPSTGGVPYEGQLVVETDANTLDVYNGSAWAQFFYGASTSYTSYVVTQGVTPTTSAKTGRYSRLGRWVIFQWEMTFSSSGTGSTSVYLGTLPVTPHATPSPAVGSFHYFESGITNHAGTILLDGPNARLVFIYDGFGANMGQGDLTIASGHALKGWVMYEAAA